MGDFIENIYKKYETCIDTYISLFIWMDWLQNACKVQREQLRNVIKYTGNVYNEMVINVWLYIRIQVRHRVKDVG
jgi:hypothetical protein